LHILKDAEFYFDSHMQFTLLLSIWRRRDIWDDPHNKQLWTPADIGTTTFVNLQDIQGSNQTTGQHQPTVFIMFMPTFPHCSMATLIGLCLRVKLLR